MFCTILLTIKCHKLCKDFYLFCLVIKKMVVIKKIDCSNFLKPLQSKIGCTPLEAGTFIKVSLYKSIIFPDNYTNVINISHKS